MEDVMKENMNCNSYNYFLLVFFMMPIFLLLFTGCNGDSGDTSYIDYNNSLIMEREDN